METGIRIGGTDKHTLEPLTDAIIRIMGAPGDQKTVRVALDLLGRVADASHSISVSDVSIVGEQHDHYHDGDQPSA